MDNKKKIRIFIIDSGVNRTHKIFNQENIKSFSYNNGSFVYSEEDNDSYGHGTAVTGIISRCNCDTEITVIGIPGLEEGLEENTLISVLHYIYESCNADIINLSLGINVCENYHELYNVCKALTDYGVIIISAFDNSGAISYPAAFDNVIGVTSGTVCNKINHFEYIHDHIVNIAAKGNIQRVAWSHPEYIMIGGNSFACAHVTAQAAEFMHKGAKTKDEILNKFKQISVKQHGSENSASMKIQRKENKLFAINKAALFPFNKEMHSLVRYSPLLSFEITDIYESKYSATVGATTTHLMKDSLVKDIRIKNIDFIEWDRFDTLILGHTDELSYLIDKEELKNNLIGEALKKNKKIYSFDDLKRSGCENNDQVFYPAVTERDLPPNRFGMLYRISKPIVGVFGTSSRQGKFTLQLKLRELLLACGYNVGQIGTEPSALLYGMDYVFPMGYNSSVYIKEFDTVRYLNYIINNLCMRDKDIIIVGSQSGTVPYDTGNIVQYTIPQYHFLLGTQPDAVILCINPYDDFDYIKKTIKFIEACTDCKVIALVVFPMNIRDGWSGIYESKKTMSDEELDTLKKTLYRYFHIPIFALGNEKDMGNLSEHVINFF